VAQSFLKKTLKKGFELGFLGFKGFKGCFLNPKKYLPIRCSSKDSKDFLKSFESFESFES
jgi:hypothetical protein